MSQSLNRNLSQGHQQHQSSRQQLIQAVPSTSPIDNIDNDMNTSSFMDIMDGDKDQLLAEVEKEKQEMMMVLYY